MPVEPITARVPSSRVIRATGPVPVALREEIALLDEVFDDVLRSVEGPVVTRPVAWLRDLAVALHTDQPPDLDAAIAELRGLAPTTARKIARAFTIHCQLMNLAEDRQRIRTLRARGRDGQVVDDAIAAGVAEVTELEGPRDAERLVQRLRIHPVLTAHPTEARRRAVAEALQRISDQLERLDQSEVDDPLAFEVRRRLAEELEALWSTAPFRHERPSPLDEVRRVLAVFDQTLFDLVPDVYREMDRALDPDQAGRRPPRTPAFLRYGSWVGGDRDGNPNVTAKVTQQTLDRQAGQVLARLERDVREAARRLTVTDRVAPASDALADSLARDRAEFPSRAASLRNTAPDQPHRQKLVLAADRIRARRDETRAGYDHPDELLADLDLVQRSLVEANQVRLAYGELQDLMWLVETFGFHLAGLELRQHSSVHTAALDELAPEAVGDAEALDRLAREGWPEDTVATSEQTREVLQTLRVAAKAQYAYGTAACHRYIVSFTRTAADLVGVRALARLAIDEDHWPDVRLDVIGLFETRDDLERAPQVLRELVALPGEREVLDARGGELEVMIGYSDSAKDVGVVSANVALHDVQGQLAQWAREEGLTLTLFHGRGGSLGRGGGPLNRGIRAQAGGSVDGRIKVTEQGEVIFARYRSVPSGRRHLERTTNAVLGASTRHAEERNIRLAERHREVADRMAHASQRTYRALIESEGFAEYFAKVTPYEEIGRMEIGSRPTHRSAARDLSTLRAIPWVFAWSQSRINLPAWFGLGTALAEVAEDPDMDGLAVLRQMRREWPFFASLIENAEMSLAKADQTLGRRALEIGERPDLTETILAEWERTEHWVLKVTGQDQLLARQSALRSAVALRQPDVDALSLLQLAGLLELRQASTDEEEARIEQVKMSVAGLSAGLQNTG